MNIKNTFSNHIIAFFVITIFGTISSCSKSSVNTDTKDDLSFFEMKSFDTSFNSVLHLLGKSNKDVDTYLENKEYLTGGGVSSPTYIFKNSFSAFNISGTEYFVKLGLDNNFQVRRITIALLDPTNVNNTLLRVCNTLDSSMRSNNYTNNGLTMRQNNSKDSTLSIIKTKYSDSTILTITNSKTLQFETNYSNTDSSTANLSYSVQLQLTISQ